MGMSYTGSTTLCCDRCMRSLEGKEWIEIDGMKICGICQYEINQLKQYRCTIKKELKQ